MLAQHCMSSVFITRGTLSSKITLNSLLLIAYEDGVNVVLTDNGLILFIISNDLFLCVFVCLFVCCCFFK